MRRVPIVLAVPLVALVVGSIGRGPATAGQATRVTVGDPAQIFDDPSLPHAVHLHQGVCDNLTEESVDLPDALLRAGAVVGGVGTSPVLSSVTTVEGRPVETSIDDLLAAPWLVAVHFSRYEGMVERGLAHGQTHVACGEIGGERLADGSLAVALRQQNGSGYAGVAYLTPDPDDPARTNVAIFLVPGSGAPGSG